MPLHVSSFVLNPLRRRLSIGRHLSSAFTLFGCTCSLPCKWWARAHMSCALQCHLSFNPLVSTKLTCHMSAHMSCALQCHLSFKPLFLHSVPSFPHDIRHALKEFIRARICMRVCVCMCVSVRASVHTYVFVSTRARACLDFSLRYVFLLRPFPHEAAFTTSGTNSQTHGCLNVRMSVREGAYIDPLLQCSLPFTLHLLGSFQILFHKISSTSQNFLSFIE